MRCAWPQTVQQLLADGRWGWPTEEEQAAPGDTLVGRHVRTPHHVSCIPALRDQAKLVKMVYIVYNWRVNSMQMMWTLVAWFRTGVDDLTVALYDNLGTHTNCGTAQVYVDRLGPGTVAINAPYEYIYGGLICFGSSTV
jgi:hypothetical protein